MAFAGAATDFHINAFLLHGITGFRSLKNDGGLEFRECLDQVDFLKKSMCHDSNNDTKNFHVV